MSPPYSNPLSRAAGPTLDAWRTELAETRALVDAAEPTSPEHESFLDYLDRMVRYLQGLYDMGHGGGDLAAVFRQGLRAFVPLIDCDWLSLRPPGIVKLDEEDEALLEVARHQRRVYKAAGEPPTLEGTVLLNVLIMTLEAIEIYILTRYADGKTACLEVWMALARVLGAESVADATDA